VDRLTLQDPEFWVAVVGTTCRVGRRRLRWSFHSMDRCHSQIRTVPVDAILGDRRHGAKGNGTAHKLQLVEPCQGGGRCSVDAVIWRIQERRIGHFSRRRRHESDDDDEDRVLNGWVGLPPTRGKPLLPPCLNTLRLTRLQRRQDHPPTRVLSSPFCVCVCL